MKTTDLCELAREIFIRQVTAPDAEGMTEIDRDTVGEPEGEWLKTCAEASFKAARIFLEEQENNQL